MKIFNIVGRFYNLHIKLMDSLSNLFLLCVRLFWGYGFFTAGLGKLKNIANVAEYFASLKIPMPLINAYMAGTTECVGGALLLIGLFSRVVTVPLVFTMIVAYITADYEAVRNIFSDPDKFLEAAPFQFLFASLLVLFFGPGKLSLDFLLKRFLLKR